jgi:alkylation response protein AidB-like acyl-CoA dehydrogenase
MGETHLIKNDQEALEIADRFAQQIEAESADRDKYRRLPFLEMELFSETGLLGMTVPKSNGGPGVSTVTFVKAVALISSADASLGQIPQNPYANIEEIRLVGTESQKAFFSGESCKVTVWVMRQLSVLGKAYWRIKPDWFPAEKGIC